jgi:hypothetical protein
MSRLLKEFWKKHQYNLLFGVIVLLAIFTGFKFGEMKSFNNTTVNLKINDLKNANPTQERINLLTESLKRQGVDLELMNDSEKNGDNSTSNSTEKCLFVASQKSHKYHTLDCRYGKNIKKENRVCFQSATEAEAKGFIPAKGCLGKKINR